MAALDTAAMPRARRALVERLKAEGISDQRVLDAVGSVPRERFVAADFAAHAYDNRPLPIGHNQTISQPYIVAYMTQELIAGRVPDKVLEIGTGCGYQAAVLASVVPRLFTVERIPELQRRAVKTLRALGFDNVHFRCADGARGWRQFAPFDAIIVTAAAAAEPPPALLEQLAPGGRLLLPLGEADDQTLTMIRRTNAGYARRALVGVRFVPLVEQA